MMKILSIEEHQGFNTDQDYLEELDLRKEQFSKAKDADSFRKKTEYLGLYRGLEDGKIVWMADYYIGYRWLDRDRGLVLHVMPKRNAKKRRIDFLGMFAECLNDIEVAKHLDETYVIDFDDDWIDIEQDDYDITHFLVLHFLKVVKEKVPGDRNRIPSLKNRAVDRLRSPGTYFCFSLNTI
jgi:hypothetical protein